MSFPYARQSAFPFPILPITLHRADGAAISPLLHAQVDTGAEMTIVPAHYLQPVAADFLQTVRLRSHWGEPRIVKLYLVDLLIGAERLSAVEVAADKQDDGILLGRNLLNRLILLLDGVHTATDLLTRRPSRLPVSGG